jgi:hypothetical protein
VCFGEGPAHRLVAREPLEAGAAVDVVSGREVAAVHGAGHPIRGAGEHPRVVQGRIGVEQPLAEKRAPAVADERHGETRMRRAGRAPDRGDPTLRGAHAARPLPAELRRVAVGLVEAGLAVPGGHRRRPRSRRG